MNEKLKYFDIIKTMFKYDKDLKIMETQASYIDILSYKEEKKYISSNITKQYIALKNSYISQNTIEKEKPRLAFYIKEIKETTNGEPKGLNMTLELRSHTYSIGNTTNQLFSLLETYSVYNENTTRKYTYNSSSSQKRDKGGNACYFYPEKLQDNLYRYGSNTYNFLYKGEISILTTYSDKSFGIKGYINTNIPIFETEEECNDFIINGNNIEKAINFGCLKSPIFSSNSTITLFPSFFSDNAGISKDFLKGLSQEIKALDGKGDKLIPYDELFEKTRVYINTGKDDYNKSKMRGYFSRIEIIDNTLYSDIKDAYIEIEYYFYNIGASYSSEGIVNIYKCRYDNFILNNNINNLAVCLTIPPYYDARFPQYSFCLMGRVYDEKGDVKYITPNVLYRHTKTYSDLFSAIYVETKYDGIEWDYPMEVYKFYEFYNKYNNQQTLVVNNNKSYLKINTNIPLFANEQTTFYYLTDQKEYINEKPLPCNILGNTKVDFLCDNSKFDYKYWEDDVNPNYYCNSFPQCQMQYLNARTLGYSNHKFMPKNLKELPIILRFLND